MAIPTIFVVKQYSRKRCDICNAVLKENDIVVVLKENDIVVDAISSSMGNHSHIRWTHLKCMLLKAEGLISKKEYCDIYDDWLVNQI
jgi:hypothetical protein